MVLRMEEGMKRQVRWEWRLPDRKSMNKCSQGEFTIRLRERALEGDGNESCAKLDGDESITRRILRNNRWDYMTRGHQTRALHHWKQSQRTIPNVSCCLLLKRQV